MSDTLSAHPYIPNSAPEIKRAMLDAVGASTVDELYGSIPERLRYPGLLDLPEPLASEYELRRHVGGVLERNQSCAERLSFLGGGCWPHYVPAVCDEVVNRGEFLTAYYGDTYGDHGKMQALFEYASLLGELVDCDAVSQPTYDWGAAAATSICMAARITGRRQAIIPASVGSERRSLIEGYCAPWVDTVTIPFDPGTGLLELDRIRDALSEETACMYLEVPGFLGVIETQAEELASLAREAGSLTVVGVDPISLGVLEAPPRYGADIVCGELQPLGIHMHYGGGLAGFVASRDTEQFVSEYPMFLIGIGPTSVEGEYAFGEVVWERTSYVQRGDSKEYTGTTQNLWAIAAGAYLAMLGPAGLAELGQTIMGRSRYAAARLDELPGVRAPAFSAPFFKEFVVDFSDTGRTVAQINRALRERGIFAGLDLSEQYPELGQSALVCVTEVHTKADIDRFADELAEVI
ncbi:MAG TPA: aminomethyl-transferring glycine dehydrogenase subunit GcvPA [Solirubrobacteraceae bacterium]|nr:aminomethyl-transferring glycine dehydrogenase subunit GcvPA [Solirubrobacteraceae bacterium]